MSLARKLTIALAAIALGWAAIVIVWGPAPFAFSFDDAYYYFTIGRNWAQGHASTFNQIDQTNGYHPLWQLICIIPYGVGLDDFAAVRSLLAFQVGLWAFAMWLVIRTVTTAITHQNRLAGDRPSARFRDGVIIGAFVVLAANPFMFKMSVNGLESGIVVPVGATLIALGVRHGGRFLTSATARDRWICGALLALAFLARTDAIILIGVLGAWVLLDPRRKTISRARLIAALVQLFTIPTVVVVAYLTVNQVVFGMPVQVSGAIKRLPITPTRVGLVLVWAMIGFGVLVATRKPIKKSSRLVHTRRFLAATGWYAAFCVGLVGYYLTLQQVPYLWYFAPLGLMAMFIGIFVCADLAESAALETPANAGVHRSPATRAPALILVVPLAAALAWSIPGVIDPGTRSIMVHDAKAARWMSGHLPLDARIGSWDAGVIGYFSDRSIVNLDGVVGNLEFYDAVHDGSWGVPDFLAARDVRWVANHGGAVNGRDPDIESQIRAYFGKDAARRITVVFSTTFAYTGTLDGSRTDTSTKYMGSYVYRLED